MRALTRWVIDGEEDSLVRRTLSKADLVFLAAPVGAIMSSAQRTGRY